MRRVVLLCRRNRPATKCGQMLQPSHLSQMLQCLDRSGRGMLHVLQNPLSNCMVGVPASRSGLSSSTSGTKCGDRSIPLLQSITQVVSSCRVLEYSRSNQQNRDLQHLRHYDAHLTCSAKQPHSAESH